MIVRGSVISVENGIALLSVPRTTSCSHGCESCGACDKPMTKLNAYAIDGLEQGSIVLVELPDNPDWLSLILVYILPVLLLVAGAVIFERLWGETAGILMGIALAAVGFGVTKLFDRAHRKSNPRARVKCILKR